MDLKEIRFADVFDSDTATNAILNEDFPGFREDYLILHCLMCRVKAMRIMEIGTHRGKGTSIITNARPDANMYSLDLSADLAGLSKQYNPEVGVLCHRSYTQLLGDSRTFDFTPFAPLDVWYIDGEHEYDHVHLETQAAVKTGAKLIV